MTFDDFWDNRPVKDGKPRRYWRGRPDKDHRDCWHARDAELDALRARLAKAEELLRDVDSNGWVVRPETTTKIRQFVSPDAGEDAKAGREG